MTIGRILTSGSGVNLEWKIKDFFIYSQKDGAAYSSPDFSFGGEEWCLNIYPHGWSGSDSLGYVDLGLYKCCNRRSIKQSFSLSFKTVKREKFNEQHYTKDFKTAPENHHEFYRFIRRSELNRRRSELMPEGVLTVVCTMKNMISAGSATGNDLEHATVGASTHRVEVSTQTVEASIQSVEASILTFEVSTQTVEEKCEASASGSSTNSHEKKVLHDLKELFLKKEDCDITIKVEGSEFPAHKAILKARSPVFASTFRHDMKENATGIVVIEDCHPSTFSDFLCFLYCGDVGIISQENVNGLYTAADKYQILDLRAKCLEFMKKNITVDTFCETLTLALRHSETELIKQSTDYFKENIPKIIVTVKWQTFLAENPTQSNELLVKCFVPNSS